MRETLLRVLARRVQYANIQMLECLNLRVAHRRSSNVRPRGELTMPYRLLAATELAEFLRALAHPRRIQILEELRRGERDVASLAKATSLAHSGVY
jgi:hypothetical protein